MRKYIFVNNYETANLKLSDATATVAAQFKSRAAPRTPLPHTRSVFSDAQGDMCDLDTLTTVLLVIIWSVRTLRHASAVIQFLSLAAPLRHAILTALPRHLQNRYTCVLLVEHMICR